MSKKTDYRRFYKDYYGIDFGLDFDVHHIDFNRENNRIDNLILLPKEVHRTYHKFEFPLPLENTTLFDILTSWWIDSIGQQDFPLLLELSHWSKIKRECDDAISSNEYNGLSAMYQHFINKNVCKEGSNE